MKRRARFTAVAMLAVGSIAFAPHAVPREEQPADALSDVESMK
jgi:hypothetical protein